ncbi:MarR family transcriptional regulator [Aeromicrobium sp. SMF47]|uniref:MarR family winged helix-turn-helix transcriptional regulator n=1 Tax=Aeromicrobium yanjiei TaxID=2662028 RepID=UPI00129D64F6|nr:MarR family transcriptional regulator [Aeromicrobium yanjiei]MRJ76555.1 MarR family transcriptional regulator [Aeromicrobium yanjiei]
MQSGPHTAEEALVRLMMVAGRRFRARSAGVIDPSQASLLYTLRCNGAMRLGDIAEAMKLDASTVSRHVQQLGDHGLIDREPDPEDGRARLIALSDAGAASLARTFDERLAFLSEALEGWSDADRTHLRDDLVRLTAALGDTA